MPTYVLAINSGSSSIKCKLYDCAEGSVGSLEEKSVWTAKLNWRLATDAECKFENEHGKSETVKFQNADFEKALNEIIDRLPPVKIRAVGHRVVHGGDKYDRAVIVDQQVKDDIRSFVELAPAHEKANLQGIEVLSKRFAGIPQVAVFDTTFHHNLPMPARLYAGPYEWYRDLGIRRFGFHGINHEYCSTVAANMIGRPVESLKIVTCHLGSGASLAAIDGGKSVMTTMGYTPLDGLMMASRSGSIDPGILIHLLQHQKYSNEQLLETLNKRSGLKGISGVTADMKELLEKINTQKSDREDECVTRSRLAFDMYIHSLRMHVGSMIAVLNGLDVLVFTGGVGENSPQVRKVLCDSLSFVGVKIDADLNSNCSDDCELSAGDAAVRVLMIRADEELAIARQALTFRS